MFQGRPSTPDESGKPIDLATAKCRRAQSRRRFLAAVASGALGGLAGCLANGGDDSDPGEDAGENGASGSSDRADGGEREDSDGSSITSPLRPDRSAGAADVLDLGTGPRTVALSPLEYGEPNGVRVVVRAEATATSESPAVFRAGLFNDRSETRTVRLQGLPPFEPTAVAPPYGDARRSLYLVPTEETPLTATEPSYERGPEGYWRIDGAERNWLPDTVEIGPEESIGGLFYLLGEPVERGFPARRYAFDTASDRDLALSVWHTDEPGPSPDSRFERGQFPGITYRLADDTVWYHDASPETARYVEPDAERKTLPAGFEFELVNNSADGLTGGGGTWDLHKFVDGEWFPLASRWRTTEARFLPPGGRHEWTFLAFGGAVPDGIDEPAHGHLGGGTYAFRPTFTHDSEETFAAAFELVGEPIEVAPDDGIDAEQEGGVVEATVSGSPSDLVVVERIDDASERIVPEQLMSGREPTLRNALPFFEPGVETVELRATGVAFGTDVSNDGDRRRFEYEGEAFEATLEELD